MIQKQYDSFCDKSMVLIFRLSKRSSIIISDFFNFRGKNKSDHFFVFYEFRGAFNVTFQKNMLSNFGVLKLKLKFEFINKKLRQWLTLKAISATSR